MHSLSAAASKTLFLSVLSLTSAACGSSHSSSACSCPIENAGLETRIACGVTGCYPVGGALRQIACANGAIADQGPCGPDATAGGGSGGSCTAAEVRCLGETPQVCTAGGIWQSGTACSQSERCAAGVCRSTTAAACESTPPGAGCTIDCTATSSCQFASATCVAGQACSAPCSATSACQFTELDCRQATSCNLACGATSSCQFVDVACGTGDCSLTCDGISACQGTASQPAIVDCTRSASCTLTCTDTSTCQGLVVLCGDGPCTLNCEGPSSCQGTTVLCGSGPCAINCTGQFSGVYAVDCGASSSCLSTCTH
jgi:hypothetical protein